MGHHDRLRQHGTKRHPPAAKRFTTITSDPDNAPQRRTTGRHLQPRRFMADAGSIDRSKPPRRNRLEIHPLHDPGCLENRHKQRLQGRLGGRSHSPLRRRSMGGQCTGEGKPGLIGARTAGPVLFETLNLLPPSAPAWFPARRRLCGSRRMPAIRAPARPFLRRSRQPCSSYPPG